VLAASDTPEPDTRAVEALQFAAQVLGTIRKKKSEEQRPLKTPVTRALIRAPEDALLLLPEVERDLRASGLIQQIETSVSDVLQVDVELAPQENRPAERAE
jgi:hypothetical protein